jgi:hypothetical protein
LPRTPNAECPYPIYPPRPSAHRPSRSSSTPTVPAKATLARVAGGWY